MLLHIFARLFFDHVLCDITSPVLIAVGLVNWKRHIFTPIESTPLNQLPKKFSQVIMSAALYLNEIWCKSVHWGFCANG